MYWSCLWEGGNFWIVLLRGKGNCFPKEAASLCKVFCSPDLGIDESVWHASSGAVLRNPPVITAFAWVSGEQWDCCVAEGTALSLGCCLVLRLDCNALMRPPVSARCQKWLVYLVYSSPYPIDSYVTVCFWTVIDMGITNWLFLGMDTPCIRQFGWCSSVGS